MEGLVIKSTGSWYAVQLDGGEVVNARIAGKFRIKGIRSTNPVAVGDRVVITDREPDAGSGRENTGAVITGLLDRRNYIIRKSINLSKQVQILAANVDLALLVVTLAAPRTSTGFIDRFLVSCEAFGVPAMLVFNKVDMLTPEGLEYLDEMAGIYKNIGYACLPVSALNGTRVAELQGLLTGKISLVAGHSGVGKSTLLNALLPGAAARTNEISAWSEKGQHTTTFAEMFALKDGGWIIDSPGISELGVVDIEQRELGHFFVEIFKFAADCRYHNCQHVTEPGCAVINAVENGEIAPSRYNSYLSIYHANETRQ